MSDRLRDLDYADGVAIFREHGHSVFINYLLLNQPNWFTKVRKGNAKIHKTYLDALSRKGMEVFRARRELARAGREMGRFFQSYDLLISPTCGRIGRPLGTLNGVVNSEISASEWARKRRDYACIAPLANVAGLPSISLPLYMSDSGLPIGVEIDGAIDQDELVLQLSAQLERAAPWSERKPPIYVSEI